MFNDNNMYVIGSIILFCIILNQKLNTVEGLCLCGGPQINADRRVRDVAGYHERIGRCEYDQKHFSSVL